MPRGSKLRSIDDSIRSTIAPIIKSATSAIAEMIARAAAEQLEAELSNLARGGAASGRRPVSRRGRPASKLTRWVTDRRARRVPTFVIEMTGLDTKKKLVAKFGEYAVFEKGKPAPAPKNPAVSSSRVPARKLHLVKAKPPVIRRATGAK